MQKQHGTTAVELILCLAISGILLCQIAPEFRQLQQRTQETQWTNEMLGIIHYARSHTVTSRLNVSLCSGRTMCSQSPDWQEQLLAFTDLNGNGRLDPEDQLIRSVRLPKNAIWRWSAPLNRAHLTYQPDGTTRALNGTLTLCHQGQPLRLIKISLNGRARTQPTETDTGCD